MNNRIGNALELLARTRNEQDPVRTAVFQALSQASPTAFADEHAASLSPLIEAALEAPDASYQTNSIIEQLLLKLVRQHAGQTDSALLQMALELLAKMGAHRGGLNLPQLSDGLPRGAEIALTE